MKKHVVDTIQEKGEAKRSKEYAILSSYRGKYIFLHFALVIDLGLNFFGDLY